MNDQAAIPIDEELFRESLARLKTPPDRKLSAPLTAGLMLLFLVGLLGGRPTVTGIVSIVAALILHESGHALGMRLFGFRDIQMFFIPFFGAAVTGRGRSAKAWQEAAVTLMGPLPGLILAMLLILFRPLMGPLGHASLEFARVLVWLNGFNLLPLGFLDGGRFLERVLFSRHRVLEVAFQVVTLGLLGYIALRLRLPVLGLFAVFTVMLLPLRWRILTVASRLRRELPLLSPDPDLLSESEARAVFVAAQQARPAFQPAAAAAAMEMVLNATKAPPSALATLGLLVAYGIGWLVAALGLVTLFRSPIG